MTKLYAFDGLKRVDIQEAAAGDIVCLAGIEDITIGETIADVEHRIAIPPIAIDEPTVSMIFGVNTSPMAGRDGQYVTSRQLKDRLDRELLGNVSIRVEPTDTPEQIKVVGRGELQLSILIEMMRREGFEMQVSRPGHRDQGDRRATMVEPVEELVIDVPGGSPGHRHRAGGRAQGHDDEDGEQRQRPRAARVPDSRARTDRVPIPVHDRHQGHRHHEPHLFELGTVAWRDSGARRTARWWRTAPASPRHTRSSTCRSAARSSSTRRCIVYEGMIIGENSRPSDMDVNVTKEKKQTNMRASIGRRGDPPDPAAQAWASSRPSSSSTTMSWWKSRRRRFWLREEDPGCHTCVSKSRAQGSGAQGLGRVSEKNHRVHVVCPSCGSPRWRSATTSAATCCGRANPGVVGLCSRACGSWAPTLASP